MKKYTVVLLLFFMLVGNVQAYVNTYAVIIGVADYKNFSAWEGDLRYTVNDAKRFYNFLRSAKGGNVPRENIVFLTDAYASKANILSRGKALFTKAGANDRVIFYFSGHGGRGYFLPYDGGGYDNKLLYYSDVKALFKCAKCSTKLLFADACFSGAMKAAPTKEIQQKMTEEKKTLSDTNIAVMMSCKGDETSIELGDLQQGVFTYFLIKGLGGLANKDGNKYITIKELFSYVRHKTHNKAAALGHAQTPELFGNFDLRLIVAQM